jgi:galactitol PTS system EIIA component
MNNNGWFFEENLIFPLNASSKEEAIQALGNLLHKNGFVKDTFVPAVVAREKEFATGLPAGDVGVAIPHTDAHHINKQAVAVGILPKSVTFCEMGDPEDSPVNVKVIFMLAVPDKNKVMTVLQQVIGIIQNKEFLQSLTTTTDRQKLVQTLDKFLNAVQSESIEKKESSAANTGIPEVKLIIRHKVGLHARPATIFVKLAKEYKSNINVYCEDRKANAKSIINVLSLGADNGSEITIQADGEDAQQALKALQELVESNFGGVD